MATHDACHRPSSPPNDAISPPPSVAGEDELMTAIVDHHLVVGEEDSTAIRPTIAEPSSPPSKPFITTATMNTFQIRRCRKLTLITVATREATAIHHDGHYPHQHLPLITICKKCPTSPVATWSVCPKRLRRCPRLSARTSLPLEDSRRRLDQLIQAVQCPTTVIFAIVEASCRHTRCPATNAPLPLHAIASSARLRSVPAARHSAHVIDVGSTSAMSATACLAHSKPRRRPTSSALKTLSQLITESGNVTPTKQLHDSNELGWTKWSEGKSKTS
ncbi:hypothetical protein ACLOJK_017961 [Asimina triloba]